MDLLEKKTAVEIGQFIEIGKICPIELTEFFLQKIKQFPESESIFTTVLQERSLELAKESKARANAGIRKSIIDGVPISIKDLADIRNELTKGGSLMIESEKAKSDAVFVKNLISNGLIPIGKTHMTELAFSGLGLNPQTKTPANSLDSTLVPGGSSSGSAVSVSNQLSVASIGSDTGGSVRIPAAWNNLVGLKTTLHSINLKGVLKLCPSFDTIGPLCKSVQDASALFSALRNKKINLLSPLNLRQLRFLVIKNVFFEKLDQDLKISFDSQIESLKNLGVAIEFKNLEEIDKALEISGTVFPAEAYATWGKLIEEGPEKMFPPILSRFRGGKDIKASDYIEKMRQLEKTKEVFLKKTFGYDAIIAPSSPIKPPKTQKLIEDFNFFTEQNILALRNTRMANSLNLCSLTVPLKTNFSGFMLFCHPNEEDKLMRIGLTLENLISKS